MKKKLVFCLAISFSLTLIQAHNKWDENKLEIAKAYLSFPNTPKYSFKKNYNWSAKDKADQVTYMMSYSEMPSGHPVSIELLEKFLLPSMLKGDIQISKKYLTYCGYKTMDFLYRTNKKPNLYKEGRIIIRNQKIYVLQVRFYYKELANFDKFSKSLKFY